MRSIRLIFQALWITACAAASLPAPSPGADVPSLQVIQATLDAGRFAEAETLARSRLALVASSEGDSSLAAADVIDLLVEALRVEGKNAVPETRQLAESALAIREAQLGAEDPALASSLAALGRLLTSLSDLEGAGPLLTRALDLRQRHLAPTDPLLGRSLTDLGNWRAARGEYREAEALYHEAIPILESSLGPDSPRVARVLLSLANCLFGQARFEEEEEVLNRAASIYDRAGLPEHPEYAVLEHIRSSLHLALGAYEQAEADCNRSIAIYEKSLGPDNQELARPLTNLGTIARRRGQFGEARVAQERALAIAEKALGPDHPLVASYLNNVAGVLYEIGALAEASAYAERALEIRERSLPPNHPDLAQSYRSLGILMEERREPATAITYYEKSLAAYEASVGKDHPEVSLVLFRLAGVLRDQGDLAGALRASSRALSIEERGPLKDHPDHAAALDVHASLLHASGECDSALAYHDRARRIVVKSYGETHHMVAEVDYERALIYAEIGRDEDARRLALDVEAKGRQNLLWNARLLPEQLALDYQRIRDSGLDLLLTLAARDGAGDPGLVHEVWDELVRSRGLLLEEAAERRRAAERSGADVAPAEARLAGAVARLAQLELEGPAGSVEEYRAALDSARAERSRSEDLLIQSSGAFRDVVHEARVGLKDVVAALPDSAALLSFVAYNALGEGGGCAPPSRQRSYLAFIATRGGRPAVVPLGSADEIDAIVAAWRGEVAHPPPPDARGSDAGARLAARIWEPVQASLESSKRVFLVADGALNWVSFAALPAREGRYLADERFLFHTLNAERELIPAPPPARAGEGLLALADPDYDSHAPRRRQGGAGAPSAAALDRGTGVPCPEFRLLRWGRLPHTKGEASEIARIWRENPRAAGTGRVVVFRNEEATEEAFKEEARGREVLHLATHGFFLGEDCDPAAPGARGVGGLVGGPLAAPSDSLGFRGLRLAGLVLAGANRAAEVEGGSEDGILTAEEIAATDLRGVGWAVLSACDTGLGEPRSGEGVLGLRRSFLIAGVRTVVMSLWSIEDLGTSAWMRELYRARFREGHDSMEAVALANRRILASRRAAGLSTHPFHWAAFQSSGDWR